jgi:hypothetical protein
VELLIVPAGSPDGNTNEAVVANEDVVALLADSAQLPVPVSDPTNDPVNDPVNGAVSERNWVELLITPSVFNSFFTPSRKCTELVSRVMVPVLVMVPPDNPSPAVIDVTPPPGALGAQLAEIANEDVVANEAVVATDEETAFCAQLLVPRNPDAVTAPDAEIAPVVLKKVMRVVALSLKSRLDSSLRMMLLVPS